MVILFFFLSGATGLVYEVLWSKYLALLFGSTIQAQTVVLAVFMSGLAIGNKLFGRSADAARSPLFIYGCIELVVGVYALFFPSVYRGADALFVEFGSRLLDSTGWLLAWKGLLSVGLLMPPTVLMGGTLPVLAAWLQSRTADPARRSALFYAANSLGAVLGAILAGFVLVEQIGMARTMEATGLVNVLIGVSMIAAGKLGRSVRHDADRTAETTTIASTESKTMQRSFRLACVLVAVTGGVSLGLEVLASRCLCLVYGASLQVFAIVLVAFILGIGLGSIVIASPRRNWSKELATILLLLGAATLIGLLVFNIENLVQVYGEVQSGLNRTPMGYRFHQGILTIVAIAILGLPAAALGSVLPLWIRAFANSPGQTGDRVGRLLTWNTLGAMAGSLLTGFVLMPHIGLRGSFTCLAAVLTISALIAALAARRLLGTILVAVVGAFLAVVSLEGDEGWRYVLSSGLFRIPYETFSTKPLVERRKWAKLLFYEDAADATVTVETQPTRYTTNEVILRINGKADATSRSDLSTQLLLGNLALMAKPDSKDVFCFGMGSGITANATLGYPIDHLTVAENCEPVLRAVRLFSEWNDGVYTNGRVRICHEDARTVLKLNPQQYDVIISEPSNPWMVGIGSVFSREFYELAAKRLKPGGLMTQWFHTYEVDDDILKLVLRTFESVFPYMEIWDVDDGDLILLGSKSPWQSSPEIYRRAFELDRPRAKLAEIGLTTPECVLARQLASQRTAFAVPGPGRVQSDNFPVLEYEAPRTFYLYLGRDAQGLREFDERTWQMDLASDKKNEILTKLDSEQLAGIFGAYTSMNPELLSHVQTRTGAAAPSQYLRSIPCVFQPMNELLIFAPEAARTNAVIRELVGTEATFRTTSTNLPAAIQLVRGLLDSTRGYDPKTAGWSAARYAALAVKACLRVGNIAAAKSILKRGLELEPDSNELGYLSRIMAREEQDGSAASTTAFDRSAASPQ